MASVRVRGRLALLEFERGGPFQAASGRPLDSVPAGRIVFGHWGRAAAQHAPTEDVVVCRIDTNTAEVHCHGGRAAVDRVVGDLQTLGFSTVAWTDEATRSDSFLAAEIDEALTRATTARTACELLRQRTVLRTEFESLAVCDDVSELTVRLDRLLEWADFGIHLTEPWSAVVAGSPNVGKSSLINALAGFDRSIVLDQPGTTRDVVTTDTALDGWPVQLSDTAGLRTSADAIESEGVRRARVRLAEADVRLVLIDVSQPADAQARELFTAWPDAICVAHKVDLPRHAQTWLPDRCVAVSSKTGAGIRGLISKVVQILMPRVPDETTAVPANRRQVKLLSRARENARAGRLPATQAVLQQLLEPPAE